MTSRGNLYRQEQLVGDPIGTLAFKNIIESDSTTIHHEQYAQYGSPLRLGAICASGESNIDRDFPYDGTDGLLDAVSDPIVTLAPNTGPSGVDVVGLLICMTTGNAAGHVRRITAWDTGTKQATCNRVWSPDPQVGDAYVLLVDCFRYNQIHLKGEIITGATNTLTFIPVFYDMPQDATGSNARAPRRFEDAPVVLISNGHSSGCTNLSGYQHLTTYSVLTRGALGAKIRVTAKDANYQLWCGAA